MTDIAAWILSLGSFAAIVLCTVFAAKNVAGDPARGRAIVANRQAGLCVLCHMCTTELW